MIQTRRGIVPAIMVCCVLATLATAEQEEAFTTIPMHKHIWQIRPEVSHFQYKEPGVMEEEGDFFGLGASYTYRPWADPDADTHEGLYLLRLEGRLAFGEVDYDGGLSNGTPYTMCDVDDTLFEFRILGGRDFLTSTSLTTFYVGFGYRYLNDDLSCDPHGYERESNYLYVPFGIQYSHGLSGGWSLTPGGEFDFLFLGLQESHLSDLDADFDDVTTSQPFGYGLRGSVRLQKGFEHFGLAVEPFVTYWNVDESDAEESGGLLWYEPRNWSMEYGVRAIVAF